MSSLQLSFYKHQEYEAKPPGCHCDYRVSTCIQCSNAVQQSIQYVFYDALPEDTHMDMNTFRVPGIVNDIVEYLRYFKDQMVDATSPLAKDNARKCVDTGFKYLLKVITRCWDPQGKLPEPFEGFVIMDPKDSLPQATGRSDLDNAVETCGEVVRIVFDLLIATSNDAVDKACLEILLVSYIYITASAARCRDRTIENFTERVIPLLFWASLSTNKVFAERAWFCIACIFKPARQWNILNGSWSPVFQVSWNNTEHGLALRKFNETYIPVEAVIEKLCLDMRNGMTVEINAVQFHTVLRSAVNVLNVIQGIASINAFAATRVVGHPQLLSLVVQTMMRMECIAFLQETQAVFNEAIKSLYSSMTAIWDKGMLVIKVAPLLFLSHIEGDCHFLRTCIYLWSANSDLLTMAEITPMHDSNRPFMLILLRTFCEDLLKFKTKHNLPFENTPRAQQVSKGFAALLKLFSASTYRAIIDDSFETVMHMQGLNLDREDMVEKSDALKQDLAQLQNICLMLGIRV